VSFDVLAVRTAADGPGDGLYPVPAEQPSDTLVVLQPEDGRSVRCVPATAILVRDVTPSGPVQLCRLSDTTATVYLTDCRIAIGCARYDRGGGWLGSSGPMLLLNGISTLRARMRSRGKVLVGHVRYSWLRSIGASDKQGWQDSEQVRLELVDHTAGRERRLLLDITLKKPFEAVSMAQDVAHRAALSWLEADPAMTADTRVALERLVSPSPLRPAPRRFAFYTLPVCQGAGVRAAG
jgi:hypothetical protein